MSIPYSVLDLAAVRVGGSVADAFRDSVSLARHVESLGYTRFWLAEHHNMPGIASAATSVLIGHVAAATSAIRVGSGGIMLPNHSSLVIAEQFGMLETLYPGRIDLGVGRAPGSDGIAARAIRRGLNSEEDFPRQVGELLALFAPASPGQILQAVPGSGLNIPVWLLGSSTYSARLAGQMGLPFAFAAHFAPQQLEQALEIYRTQFQPSKYLAESYAIVGLPLIAAETDSEARRLATSAYQRALKLFTGQPIFLPPPVDSMDGLWSTNERLLVESKFAEALVGGPLTIRQKLDDFVDRTGADEVMFASDLFEQAERLRSYEIGAEVALATGVKLRLET